MAFENSPKNIKCTITAHYYRRNTSGLLRVEPGLEEEPLRDTLENIGLNSGAHYSVILYAWGSDIRPHRIDLRDGKYLELTLSLFNALRDLRPLEDKFGGLALWGF
jgi:hypothetical protein